MAGCLPVVIEHILFRSLIVIALLVTAVCSTYAQSARDLVRDGNQSYHSGEFDQALATYEKAAQVLPDSAEVYFNQGAALYQAKKFKTAREKFSKAASNTKDLALEARAKFNQGNCLFRESEQTRTSDLQASLKPLESSILNYQQAIKLDPRLTDAAHNIEVARLTLKAALDQIKTQQEEAEKAEQARKEAIDKLKDLTKRQANLARQTQELNQNSEQHAGQCNNLASTQRKLTKETKDLRNKLAESSPSSNPATTQARDYLRQSTESQQDATRQLEQEDSASAKPATKEAAEALRKALEQLHSGNQPPPEQTQEQGESQGQDRQQSGSRDKPKQSTTNTPQSAPEPPPAPPTPASAKPSASETAANILGEEQETNKRRQLGIIKGHRAVDKDW